MTQTGTAAHKLSAEAAAERRTAHRRKILQTLRDNAELSLMVLPGVVGLILFNYLPMYGIVIAFKNYNPVKGIFGSPWVGLKNFEMLFRSSDLFRLLRNTVLYSLDFLVIDMLGCLIVALLLYFMRSRVGVKIYNTIMILPKFMSIVLIAYIVYSILNPASGILNQFNVLLGGKKVDWYAKPGAWPVILSVVEVWRSVGYGCILYYATMVGIDESLFEAAKLDGANRWQQTIHIILPSLKMIICINLILAIGGLFGGDMGLFYQVPQNITALYPTTDIINTYTYRGTLSGQYSTSSAIGLFQNAVGLLLVLGSNAVVRRISPENSLL